MAKSVYLLILALILFTVQTAKFNIGSVSVCTDTSAAGFCTRWQQNGTVEQQSISCFAGSMIVLTKQGYKTMNELQIGDEILAYDRDQGQIYTTVRGFFHREPEVNVGYLNVTFLNGQSLIVSDKHNIAFKDDQSEFEYKFAQELVIKDSLFGSINQVAILSKTKSQGKFAPMTYSNNYFVFTSKSDKNFKILAHDFANIRYPQLYEGAVSMIMSTHEYFKGKQNQIGIHPAAQQLMRYFHFMLE